MKSRNILDLRNMPMFFEELPPEESFVPVDGPQRIDSLTRRHKATRTPRIRANRTTRLVISLLILISGASAMAYTFVQQPHPTVAHRPTTATKIVAAPTPPATATAPTTRTAYVVPTLGVKVYTQPTATSATVGILSWNTAVTVVSQSGEWSYLQYGDQRGYVPSTYLADVPQKYPSTQATATPSAKATPQPAPGVGDAAAPSAPSQPDPTPDPILPIVLPILSGE
jgi:hypothetical protein